MSEWLLEAPVVVLSSIMEHWSISDMLEAQQGQNNRWRKRFSTCRPQRKGGGCDLPGREAPSS